MISFEYASVHGALAAAYTAGTLAAEFGAERVRVSLPADPETRGWPAPLLAELNLADALRQRYDTRLLGLVSDGDGPAWALVTAHVRLERDRPLLVRALSALLLARPHRPPLPAAGYPEWAAEGPLRAANILVCEEVPSAALEPAA